MVIRVQKYSDAVYKYMREKIGLSRQATDVYIYRELQRLDVEDVDEALGSQFCYAGVPITVRVDNLIDRGFTVVSKRLRSMLDGIVLSTLCNLIEQYDIDADSVDGCLDNLVPIMYALKHYERREAGFSIPKVIRDNLVYHEGAVYKLGKSLSLDTKSSIMLKDIVESISTTIDSAAVNICEKPSAFITRIRIKKYEYVVEDEFTANTNITETITKHIRVVVNKLDSPGLLVTRRCVDDT